MLTPAGHDGPPNAAVEGAPAAAVGGQANEPTDRPRTAGSYQLERRIGRGAMGEVWFARHAVTGSIAAVKMLRDGSPRGRDRLKRFFDRERRAVARLDHPHVAPLFEIGPDYIASRFIEGSNLARRLATPIQPAAAVEITLQIAAALAHAHDRQVIHRDVKPSNILLDSSGNAYLSDFGLAAILDDEADPPEGRGGTPQYMAPEQARGEPPGPPADQYSLGRVLAEMLAGGRVPADPEQAVAALPATLPPPLIAAVRRAIDPEPAQRWPSLADLARELGAVDLRDMPAPRRLLPEIRVKMPFAWAAVCERQQALSPTIARADYRLSALEASGVITREAGRAFRERTGYADFGWSVFGRTDRLGAITDPMAYARAGELVVALHGGMCTRETWVSVASHVAHGNAQTLVIAPDISGYGVSRYTRRLPHRDQVSAEGTRDAVLAWLELLGIRELPMVLIGHSLGGTTVLTATDDQLGPRTARLALAPVFPEVDPKMRWALRWLPVIVLALAWIPGMKWLLANLVFSWSGPARMYDRDERRAMVENFMSLPVVTLARTSRSYARARCAPGDQLARCIVALADKDPVAPIARTRRSLRAIGFADANVHLLVCEGHQPHARTHMHPEWTARNVHEITRIVDQLLIAAREGSVLPTQVASTLISTGSSTGSAGLAEGSTEQLGSSDQRPP